MKICIFSDTHFNNDKQENNNVIYQSLLEMKSICQKNNIEYFIFAGDLFETKKIIDVRPLNLAYAGLSEISLNPFYIDAIPGNHDSAMIKGNQYSLKPFSGIMKVYEKPYSKVYDNNIEILFVPFGYNFEDYYENQDYVVLHDDRFLTDFSELKKFKTNFILGHIHEYQVIKNKNYKIIIPGSLTFQSFKDKKCDAKGFVILNTETNETEFVEIKSPKYLEIKINNDEELNAAIKIKDSDSYNHYQFTINYNKPVMLDNVKVKYNNKINNDVNINRVVSVIDAFKAYINNNSKGLNEDKLNLMLNDYLKKI
jgi:DNA repair exonuclease SbcCD nuclease subunit